MEITTFGAVESAIDPRQIKSTMLADKAEVLPDNAIIKFNFKPVDELFDQLRIGTCTACATDMSAQEKFRDGQKLSFWWNYIMQKVFYDDPQHGFHFEGSSALTALKTRHRYGCASADMDIKYPLNITGTYHEFWQSFLTLYQGIVPQEVIEDAAKRKIPGYAQITVDAVDIAKQISAGRTVIIRMSVGENLYKDKNGKYSMKASDLLPLRAPKRIDSGHLMVINEYNGLTIMQELSGPNSWGKRFCYDNKKNGAGYFNFILETQLPFFTEAWVILDEAPKFKFTKTLREGMEDPEVVMLQLRLEKGGFLDMPKNVKYGYFGRLTKEAVKLYQLKYADKILKPAGLTKPTGVVAKYTIAQLNAEQ